MFYRKNTLTVTDNRTGKQYNLPIYANTVDGNDVFKIKAPTGAGLRMFDPGYMNTCSTRSKVCFIDGAKGILRYRGYPIEQLAEKSTFLEVAFLLIHGELPTPQQSAYFNTRVMRHTYIHEELKKMMRSFRYDAHPMGMVMSTVAAMGTFHPEANPSLAGQDCYKDITLRNKQVHRALGTMSTISAYAYRHRIGRPPVDPSNSLDYAENFLYMLDRLNHKNFKPHPRLARALDVLFILHADHEQNASTAAMRHLTSTGVDVYSCLAGSVAALYGPRHGGANEAVVRMLEEIGDISNIPAFIEGVKNKTRRLMGFGHRVYKNYDPRARIIRTIAEEVFSILGKEPLIEVAVELERIALSDKYFVDRKLYPNVDFYSGLIYKAMGFPTDYFPVLFTIPRTAGWLAHWYEFNDDKDNRIVRPFQIYEGYGARDYVPEDARASGPTVKDGIFSNSSAESKRRSAGSDV